MVEAEHESAATPATPPSASTATSSSATSSPATARPRSPSQLKPKRFGYERSTSYREKKSKKEYRDLRRHRSFSGAEGMVCVG